MEYERVLIIGASGGIGRALSTRVDAVEVFQLSRSRDGFDLLDEGSIAAAADALEGPFDLIFDATGALEVEGVGPEKSIAVLDHAAMARQFALNAIGPALIFKHFIKHLPRDKRAVIATLSARVGSIEDNRLGGWISYRAAKAALNQIVKTTSIELSRTHQFGICAAVHPGTVRTELTEKYLKNHSFVEPTEAAENILNVLRGLNERDSGGFFDWRGMAVPWWGWFSSWGTSFRLISLRWPRQTACPLKALNGDFLHRNRNVLGKNQRLGLAYPNWDKMDQATLEELLATAAANLKRLDDL